MFLTLFIVNSSGGLVYTRQLSPLAPKINTNDSLRIASTLHSLHAIAAEAAPVKLPGNKNPRTGADDGIEVIEAGGMIMQCLQTRTGMVCAFLVCALRVGSVYIAILIKYFNFFVKTEVHYYFYLNKR